MAASIFTGCIHEADNARNETEIQEEAHSSRSGSLGDSSAAAQSVLHFSFVKGHRQCVSDLADVGRGCFPNI